MQKTLKNADMKMKIIIAAACFLLMAAAVIFAYIKTSGAEKTITEDVAVETADMSRTVTAAGEIRT